jgi:hypothetical protein
MAMIRRNHSRPLDIHRWSQHPEATKLVDSIWNDYFQEAFKNRGKGNRPKSKPKKQFKVLLLDLYVVWLDDPELSLGVGMTKSAYKQNSRYNKLYISAKMIDVVNRAYEVGLIDKETGSELSGMTTRIRASKLLQSIFKKSNLSLFDLTQEYPNKEVIILNKKEYKDKVDKTVSIDYEDTDYQPIETMRHQLEEYNSLLWKTFIDIPTQEHPFIEQPYFDRKTGQSKVRKVRLTQDNKFVRRVFYRADWNLGGRFHGGWWQSIKEDYRKQIYINDNSTIEQDYSGLHINLLYGLQGVQPQKDPYTLDKIMDFSANEQRKIVKMLALMGINARSPEKAFSAFRQNQEIGSIEKELKDKQLQILLDAFKEKHPQIADSICTDKGVELMNIDGKITAKVINHFTKKQIPVLTIHDSYITENKHSGELRKVMNNAVTEELNGFKINIDQEGVGFDQIQTFRNMDRTNVSDYDYNQIVSYNKTKGYIKRYKKHTQWLTINNIQSPHKY